MAKAQSKAKPTQETDSEVVNKGRAASFDNVLLKSIIPDPNQPRQYYDAHALEELTESIRENGVYQPILVRPAAKGKYMIVCGERRYRASLSVMSTFKDRDTIPAVIREMTDEEALEAQIIENLQRKDVKPMEDAVAFKSLHDKKGMDVKEIALRVGKSPSYVALRIQLNFLIPEFQEMLSRDMTDLQSAQKLSRLSEDQQKMILNERTQNRKDWRKDSSFMLGNITWFINNSTVDLGKAPFKITDKSLYPDMGACTTCQHNTANKPLLFEEMKGKHCTLRTCFAIKAKAAYQRKVEEVINDPNIIPVLPYYWHGEEDEMRINTFKELGIRPLKSDEYTRNVSEPTEPDHPGTFEEYIDTIGLDEDDDPEEYRDDYNDEIRDYQEELRDYEQELADYEKSKSEGFKKGFMICGHDAGKIIDIIVKTPVDALNLPSDAADEIVKITNREKRAKELDLEKIQKRIADEVKALDISQVSINSLEVSESIIRFMVWEFAGWYLLQNIATILGIENPKIDTPEDLQAFLFSLSKVQLYKLAFVMLQNKYCSYTRFDSNGAYFIRLFAQHAGIPVDAYVQEQQEKAEKRQKRVNERITELKAKAETVV